MTAAGIPDILVRCLQPGCRFEALCVTSIADAETWEGRPTVLVRVDTTPLGQHRRAMHPEVGA